MARNDLSAVVYDDSGTYTMAEPYAASAELRMQDEAYFSSLSAKLTNGGDNRDFFKSILDYFDDLPPVEKAATRMVTGTASTVCIKNSWINRDRSP